MEWITKLLLGDYANEDERGGASGFVLELSPLTLPRARGFAMDDEWSLPDFTFSRRHKPATTVVRSIRRHYWGQIANFLVRAMMRSWRL